MKVPILKSNGKYSFRLDSFNEFDKLDFLSEGYAIAKIGDKNLFVDEEGYSLKLKFEYDELRPFSNGLAPVKKGDMWSFINKKGEEVNKRSLKEYHLQKNGFIEGYYFQEFQNSFFNFEHFLLNHTGQQILHSKGNGYSFKIQNDFILVKSDKEHKAIDFYGNPIFITKDYSYISDFYNGYAIAISENEKVSFIDKKLNVLRVFNEITATDIETLYYSFSDEVILIKKNGKYGFIDFYEKKVCEFKYDYLSTFENNFAIAAKYIDGNLKYSFLNRQFEEVIDFQFDYIENFSEDRASFKINGLWGVIDEKGRIIIPAEFNQIGKCQNGFIWVSVGDYKNEEYYGKYGCYNKEGKKICPLVYDEEITFDNETAIVKLNNDYNLINKKGIEVTERNYEYIDDRNKIKGFYFAYGELNKRFVIDENGKEYTESSMADDLPF